MRYKRLLQKADAIALRLKNSRRNTSRFCSDVAAAFFRLRDYQRGERWLRRVYTTRDRDIRVIERFFGSGDPNTVAVAIVVAGSGGKDSTAMKIAGIFSGTRNRRIRLAAYQAIARTGSVRAGRVLYRNSGLGKNCSLVEEVALYKMLGQIKGVAPSAVLYNRYRLIPGERKGKAEYRLRLAVLEALIVSGAQGVVPFLKRLWNTNPALRLSVARFLEKGSAMDYRPFIRSVLPGAGQDLYAALLRSWAKKGVEAAHLALFSRGFDRFRKAGFSIAPLLEGLQPLSRETVRPLLRRFLKDEKGDFNSSAVLQRLLVKNRDAALVDDVLKSVRKREKDFQYISLMVDALGGLGSRKAVPYLEKCLKHSAPGVRLLAAQSLKKLTGKAYKFKGFGE